MPKQNQAADPHLLEETEPQHSCTESIVSELVIVAAGSVVAGKHTTGTRLKASLVGSLSI